MSIRSIKTFSTKQVSDGGTAVDITDDVQNVIQTMITENTILDEDDVNGMINEKLTDYTTTADLQADYATKTLLTNTLDNYTSKELLTQSLSEKANYTTTDALESTTNDHETRLSGLESNFVSKTALAETLTTYLTATDLDGYATTSAMDTMANGKANSLHSHAISDVTDLATTLSGKASSLHTHAIADVTDLATTLNGKANSSHTHAIADVTDLATTLSGKANSSHTHTMSDITDYTAPAISTHTHTISDVTDLQTTLNGKASSSHSHAISDVIDLQTTLNGKASSSHSHLIDDLKYDSNTTLKSVVDGKADTSHNHDSTYAKLNADSTFDNVGVNYTINIHRNIIQTNSSMELNTYLTHYIGCSTSNKESGRIRFYRASRWDAYCMQLGITGYDALELYYDNINALLPLKTRNLTVNSGYSLTTPAITLNGTDLATTLNNCAKLSAANTFTVANTFTKTIYHLDSSLSSGNSIDYYIGKMMSYECGFIRYNYSSTLSQVHMGIGFSGSEYLQLYTQQVRSVVPLKVLLDEESYDNMTPLRLETPQLAAGHSSRIIFGRDSGTDNSAFIKFNYAGANSNNNSCSIGFDTYPKVLEVKANNTTTINGATTVNGQFNVNYNNAKLSMTVSNLKWLVGDGVDGWYYFLLGCSEETLMHGYLGYHNKRLTVMLSGGTYIDLYQSSIYSSVQITVASDRRLKENIEPISVDESENIIDNVKVYSFNMKSDTQEKKIKYYGVIAQELKEIAPDLVFDDGSEDHYLGVNYTGLIPHLINKIHQQSAQIQQLETKLNKLYELLDVVEEAI